MADELQIVQGPPHEFIGIIIITILALILIYFIINSLSKKKTGLKRKKVFLLED